jgi:hypothetical protein
MPMLESGRRSLMVEFEISEEENDGGGVRAL